MISGRIGWEEPVVPELDLDTEVVVYRDAVGNAVRRNRAKRFLREAVRSLIPEIAPGWDFVILARQPMEKATFIQTREALIRLLQRAKLLVKGNEC